MAKQVTFYYVRHGKTEFNRDGIIQGGRVDSPLVPETLPVLDQTAQALSAIDLAQCWCSPLGRAQASAERILKGRKVPLKTLESLHEFDFGELDGESYAEHRLSFARHFVRQDFSDIGGESGDEVRSRVQHAFRKMFKEAKNGDSVLVVAHGALLRSVLLEFSRMSQASRKISALTMKVPNGSISTISGDGGKFVLRAMPTSADAFVPYVPVEDPELEDLF